MLKISFEDWFLINKLRLDVYSHWKILPSILGMGKEGKRMTKEQKEIVLKRWIKEYNKEHNTKYTLAYILKKTGVNIL